MDFGIKLQNLRKEKKLSQEQLAEKLNVQDKQYQNGNLINLIQKWKS
jgi:transcriptional regulator with XRE-family HTH domain